MAIAFIAVGLKPDVFVGAKANLQMTGRKLAIEARAQVSLKLTLADGRTVAIRTTTFAAVSLADKRHVVRSVRQSVDSFGDERSDIGLIGTLTITVGSLAILRCPNR